VKTIWKWIQWVGSAILAVVGILFLKDRFSEKPPAHKQDLDKQKEKVKEAKKKVEEAIKETDKAKENYDKVKEENDAKIKETIMPITDLSDAIEYGKQSVRKRRKRNLDK